MDHQKKIVDDCITKLKLVFGEDDNENNLPLGFYGTIKGCLDIAYEEGREAGFRSGIQANYNESTIRETNEMKSAEQLAYDNGYADGWDDAKVDSQGGKPKSWDSVKNESKLRSAIKQIVKEELSSSVLDESHPYDKMIQDDIDEMSDMLYTAGYEDADQWAKKLREKEGIDPIKLKELMDNANKKGSANYFVRWGMKKRAGLKTESVTSSKSDKDVLGAFLTREKADGKKLSTDGNRLHINGLGGNNVAEWVDDGNGEKIKFNDLGSKTAQQVQNAIAKIAPRNWLLNGKGY